MEICERPEYRARALRGICDPPVGNGIEHALRARGTRLGDGPAMLADGRIGE
jgi:hypothetical protein